MSIFSKSKNNQAPEAKKEEASTSSARPAMVSEVEPTLAELKAKKEKEVSASAAVVKKAKSENTKNAYKVLVKPLVTEKGTYLASENKYLFEVAGNTNKVEIKKAIHALYGVSAIKVNVILKEGKKVRYGKTSGSTKSTKKAIVTLKAGQTIQVYEGV